MTLGELISAHPKIRKRHGAPSHAPSSSCSRTPTGYGWIWSQSVTVRVVMMKHHFDTCSHLFHLLKHIWHIWHIWVYKGLSQVSCISTNWYGPFSCHKQTTPKYLKNLEIIKVKLETSKQRQSAERTIQDGLVGYMFPTIVNNHKHQRGTPSFIHVIPCLSNDSAMVNPPHWGTIEDAVHCSSHPKKFPEMQRLHHLLFRKAGYFFHIVFHFTNLSKRKKTPGDWKSVRFLDSLFACCPENIFRP